MQLLQLSSSLQRYLLPYRIEMTEFKGNVFLHILLLVFLSFLEIDIQSIVVFWLRLGHKRHLQNGRKVIL